MKKSVFLTGATGNMGWHGFQELLKKQAELTDGDELELRILARDSKKNRKLLAPYADSKSIKIIWGDLLDENSIKRGVEGVDYVLHVGGMVSPAADYFPDKTLETNIGAAKLICKVILQQPDADNIKLVYIGSVAQYGNRMGEVQWGRTGDPVRASLYDMYSVSKCEAERIIVNSGIKKWVSLRQSGILYAGILKVVNPTAFHVPIRGVLEWATVEDSGRLLANVTGDDVPDEFWNRFYNISSGEQYRMTNYEFEYRLLKAIGLRYAPDKVFEPQHFAMRNFHGMLYEDSDVLENYLHFRANIPLDEYFAGMKSKLPWFYKLAFLAPAFAVKFFMGRYAFEKGMGTQDWVRNDKKKFLAYYGSREAYDNISSWAQMRPGYLEKNLEKAVENGELVRLNHGYDESKSISELSVEELNEAAAFRGGKFAGPVNPDLAGQSGNWMPGAQFYWECEHGHRFTASLEYVLLGGGWCSECGYLVEEPYKETRNAFLRQILK